MLKRLSLLVLSLGFCGALLLAADAPPAETRAAANKAMKAGNFKDAYTSFNKLAVDPGDDPALVSQDLQNAIQCLQRLNRNDEVDDLRDKVIAAHDKNWRLLWTAAKTFHQGETYGYIVAGKFYRGYHRGGGRYVYTIERDRIRALQLMQQAMELNAGEANKDEVSSFYFSLSEMLLDARYGDGAWRLQYLSDLSKLPDFDEGYRYYGGNGRGAPVKEDGMPVYHSLPQSWKESTTDGQRWRWCLARASDANEQAAGRATLVFATFLRGQFDVQTMAQWGYGAFIGRAADEEDGKKNESGPYAVSTLTEDETISRLASGIKRFKLPEEYNFIKILQKLADGPKNTTGEQAMNMLGQLFEDRQQYPRAAQYWTKGIEFYGKGQNEWRQQRLDQVIGNWARFDPPQNQPAGKDPFAYLVFRNGKKVSFEAHEINVKKLLDDVKAYIKTKPNQLDWESANIESIGHRLIEKNQTQYLVKQTAKWDMDLTPRDKHFDKRVKVTAPIKQPGAYLLKGTMANGNTTSVVLWVADTVIVKKPTQEGAICYVADAVTGAPIARANVEFFGYQQQWVKNNEYRIDTRQFAEFTDADGLVQLKPANAAENQFSWLIIATTDQGRLAHYGFAAAWPMRGQYDQEYNARKTFFITDRPVYRPGQTVKFKFWANQAQYDREGPSPWTGQSFIVKIHNPKNEKVSEQKFTADGYGGFDGEYTLPKDATLGAYGAIIDNFGGGNFRVEEYKKPEFEVKVDAPTEPVMLGDKISAKMTAKYYFGAPVTNAKVKYKVMRNTHNARWYPSGKWDWFYGEGYWWFASDYLWYPGWERWGTARPMPWWYRQWRYEQPEIVAENEVPVGADGTISIEIDTTLAKLVHGDDDHAYTISAEVTDQSRRTIVGEGKVLVARRPFKVYSWVDRGFYMSGDEVEASFSAQTLDNKGVKGKGELKLIKIAYGKDMKPVETEAGKWQLDTNDEGKASQKLKAAAPGQYRLSYTVTDSKNRAIEGGYVFVVRGKEFDGKDFRFNDLELTADKREYAADEKVKLMVNANRANGTVLLFVRAANAYLPPKVIRLNGKSAIEEIAVMKKDMPNFYVEALTVSDGREFTETREIVVPPESRVINVAVLPNKQQYKPGEKAKIQMKLTDAKGAPILSSAVVSVYDKAVEYISGGSNVPEIKDFFWKWRRSHQPHTESSFHHASGPFQKSNTLWMQSLGAFGAMVADIPMSGEALDMLGEGQQGLQEQAKSGNANGMFGRNRGLGLEGRGAGGMNDGLAVLTAAPASAAPGEVLRKGLADRDFSGADKKSEAGGAEPPSLAEPTVRRNFADTALWVANLTPNGDGIAEVELTMPENLSTWKARVWSMGAGARVGEGSAEVVTFKNLLVRLQAPRFFTQSDQVVISANVHNYLKTKKTVKVTLDLAGNTLAAVANGALTTMVDIDAGGEKRVDFLTTAVAPGEAIIRVSAQTDEESDAMEMRYPVYVHGMLKTDSFSGAMRPGETVANLAFTVPAERIPSQSRLEIRYSPSVALAMVDALPYLVDYPYDTTDTTLHRFLPTVITQKVLLDMKLDLKDIQKKRTNLNAQEIGDDPKRAQDWKRNNPPNPGLLVRNAVFDVDEVRNMTKAGVEKLTAMQLSDGGWGWFSGWGEHSSAHTTAQVIHGLQIAKLNDVAIVPGVMDRGVAWLQRFQAEQVKMLKNAPTQTKPWKEKADNLDALVYMVLVDANVKDNDMHEFLYRDRIDLAVYAKALYGLAVAKLADKEKLDMIMANISQFVVRDDANQTAYLKLPQGNPWWYWYGSNIEAMGYYLKLLAKTDPKGETAPRLAKYLVNNRKHASYWNSTRDTAICIEALADYIRASGEDKPDMTVVITLDGKKAKEVKIDAANLFTYDNKLVITGPDVTAGRHTVEFSKTGTGPLYFNAYITNFTLEDPIKRAGLEVTVNRKFYKLNPVDKKIKVSGARGQALDQKVEKYERQELSDNAMLKSGDLVEVELEIDSKNDYEYLLFEDMKAAGFEAAELRSGYNANDMGAYMELRDERVAFFVRTLARGKHSMAYRLRAEIPGKFSALPTKAMAMYAPELRGNSDEAKLRIQD